MSKTTAFAYLRVSGKAQVKGDGFPRQRLAISKYAAAHHIEIVTVFEEKGVSGDLEYRPAWSDMLTALVSNGCKLVLVEKLDRLARDLLVQETLIGDLRKRGFEFQSVMEPDLCSDDPSRVLVRQIFGSIAQYEKAMIVAKLSAARQRMKAATGKCEGRKLYGEKPGEAETRDRIRSMRRSGSTLQSICDALNADAVPTRHGGTWLPMTVRNIAAR